MDQIPSQRLSQLSLESSQSPSQTKVPKYMAISNSSGSLKQTSNIPVSHSIKSAMSLETISGNGDGEMRDEDDEDEDMGVGGSSGLNGQNGNGHTSYGNGNGEAGIKHGQPKKKGVIHIEVRLMPHHRLQTFQIRQIVQDYILENFERVEVGAELESWDEMPLLQQNAERIVVAETSLNTIFPDIADAQLNIHVYRPSTQNGMQEFAATTGDDDDDEENVMAATVMELPSRNLDGLWDSLIYPEDIKPRLLNYIHTTLLFSDADVDFNIVTWNRVVLLHGPPGTGKTSLCKALAQKLAIRLSNRYSHGRLVEINSHSLFSKWFSESGKLVQKLFARVTEMIEDESGFVVVLIDEVESLTAARAGAMSGTEPSDALRVVNALLTQLDKLKHRKNVLVMSTSNIAQAIDSAFVDRADIKQYIGVPPPEAVYWILKGCLEEMAKRRLMEKIALLEWKQIQQVLNIPQKREDRERIRQASLRLAGLAEACQGMSGRTLRRLPVLAYARYIAQNVLIIGDEDEPQSFPVEEWLTAIERVVKDEGVQKEELEKLVGTGGI